MRHDNKRKRITIVGCGGVGGWIVRLLAATHELALIDGDTVEEKNLDRQLFTVANIGERKAPAMAAYASQLPGAETVRHVHDDYWAPGWQPRWESKAMMCCVDNFRGQAALLEYADRRGVPVIICANEEHSASAVIYLPAWKDHPERDPRVRFTEISVDNTTGDPLTPHCFAEVAAGRQTPFANMSAAVMGVSLLTTWIDGGVAGMDDEVRDAVAYRHEMAPSRWRSTI